MSSPEKPRNILVVEDEWLIALDLSMLIEELGHVVVGPAQNVVGALELIEGCEIDAAFLDINLGSEKSFPVAKRLEDLNIPLAFVSAYATQDIPPDFRKFDLLPKPLTEPLFCKQLLKMIDRG